MRPACLALAAWAALVKAVPHTTTGPLTVLWTYDTKPESYYTVALGDGFLAAGTDGMTNCRTDVFDPTNGKLQVTLPSHPHTHTLTPKQDG
jgi:hypothetical protein